MQKFALETKDVAEGKTSVVEVSGTEIGIALHQGKYYAYRNICPHQGGPVCEGMQMPRVTGEFTDSGAFERHNFDTTEMHLVCPWHGWEFDIATGEAVGDRSIRLESYAVSERDGKLYVDI